MKVRNVKHICFRKSVATFVVLNLLCFILFPGSILAATEAQIQQEAAKQANIAAQEAAKQPGATLESIQTKAAEAAAQTAKSMGATAEQMEVAAAAAAEAAKDVAVAAGIAVGATAGISNVVIGALVAGIVTGSTGVLTESLSDGDGATAHHAAPTHNQ